MLFKVVVNNPLPAMKKGDAFEDTMLLIDMVKQHVQKNNEDKKVGGKYCRGHLLTNKIVFQEEYIRQMAMEMKRRINR